jgi:hypothetical protein
LARVSMEKQYQLLPSLTMIQSFLFKMRL